MLFTSITILGLAAMSQAHTVGWAKGMYCKGGNDTSVDDQNTNLAVNPLYQLSKEDYWFQHDRGCDQAPPPEGEFLELQAGGQVTLELAHNRAQTTLSYNGQYAGEWPDGQPHPEDWNGNNVPGEGCIQDDGAMHVSNQTDASGTALAISYVSDIKDVTMDNLVVFSVLEHTPWKRIANYSIPAALPACPPGGCICAWLWIPRGCGIQNMYMAGYKCNVTGATSTAPVAKAQTPVYCADDATKCVKGAKSMVVWHQLEGNNVIPADGSAPGYSMKLGWAPGAQNDIFVSSSTPSSTSAASATSPAVSSVAAPSTLSTVTKPSTTSTPTTTPTIILPISTPTHSTTTKADTTALPACTAAGKHQHRRAIGRLVGRMADKLEQYDI